MNCIKIVFLGEKKIKYLFKTEIQLANFSKKDILNNATVVSSENHV